jgi:cytochrome P450
MSAIDLDAVHIADSAFWAGDASFRHAVFAALRRDAPVRWFEPRRSAFSRRCSGFWAVTRYHDVWAASRNPRVFCSGRGIDIEESPPELVEFLDTMITMDDPAHARLRRLVSAGFTPRQTARLHDRLHEIAETIVDDVLERWGGGGEFDLVEHVASRLPLATICELVGVPPEDQERVFALTNAIVAPDDPAVGVEGAIAANHELAEYGMALGRARVARPADDLTSTLMHATVDGDRLGPREFANFLILLLSAGNETTRNAITHGVRLLTQYPDQRAIWFADFEAVAATAVDEIVRFESPITHMARVATEDSEIAGVPIREGDKVALWYVSANRDGDVFERPDEFDVRRPLVPAQVGYGAGGPHFCLGANLARREIAVMFDAIRRKLPGLHATGEPERVVSMGLNAVRTLPVTAR